MLANQVSQAKTILQKGGLIAYSTETVLGLGCNPFNENAVKRILWLKNRAVANGLVLLVDDIQAMQQYTKKLSATQISTIELAQNTTWLVPANINIPKWIIGRYQTVAIRISKHPITQQLCSSNDAIVSTSANISEHKILCTNIEIRDWFGPYVDYVIIGIPGSGAPSEIRDLLSGKKFR